MHCTVDVQASCLNRKEKRKKAILNTTLLFSPKLYNSALSLSPAVLCEGIFCFLLTKKLGTCQMVYFLFSVGWAFFFLFRTFQNFTENVSPSLNKNIGDINRNLTATFPILFPILTRSCNVMIFDCEQVQSTGCF